MKYNFTKEFPTLPGAYFARDIDKHEDFIIIVVHPKKTKEEPDHFHFASGHTVELNNPLIEKLEFAPIPDPVEPDYLN